MTNLRNILESCDNRAASDSYPTPPSAPDLLQF